MMKWRTATVADGVESNRVQQQASKQVVSKASMQASKATQRKQEAGEQIRIQGDGCKLTLATCFMLWRCRSAAAH